MKIYYRESWCPAFGNWEDKWRVVSKKEISVEVKFLKEKLKAPITLTNIAKWLAKVYPNHEFRVGKHGKVHQ